MALRRDKVEHGVKAREASTRRRTVLLCNRLDTSFQSRDDQKAQLFLFAGRLSSQWRESRSWASSERSANSKGTHFRRTEPLTPLPDQPESAKREATKGVGRQLVRSKAPNGLWNWRRASFPTSFHADHSNNYQLNDESLKQSERRDVRRYATIAKFWRGIRHYATIADFQRYEWIGFRGTAVCPGGRRVLGKDFGLAIDIWLATERTILREERNGSVPFDGTLSRPRQWEKRERTEARVASMRRSRIGRETQLHGKIWRTIRSLAFWRSRL
jgi:hypothetical protein